jgi:hypothetical protein
MTTERPNMIVVADGRTTIGFVMRRGPRGVEAYDADERSIGMFADVNAAATAVWKHARAPKSDDA